MSTRSDPLTRLFPFLVWWPLLNRKNVKSDVIAGLTGAVVVLPQGVAFATIAGMPPEYGLYAGMVPAIIAALFGSSWHLVSGPTTAASIVLFSSLSVYAEPGSVEYVTLALTMTLMVGLIELGLGLARMGALVNFISHSVIVGFTAGAAILIASKQLKNFFGVEIPRGGHLHDVLISFWGEIAHINGYVTVVAAVTLLSGIAVKRWVPKLPYLIVAMVAGSLVSLLINQIFGSEVTGIATVGALPSSLPPLSSPSFSLDTIKNLAPASLAVTLFALTEAVSIGRSLGARSGQRIDGNQEFIGQGLSNIAGSFFSGYVATGSFNRSGLNYQAGAQTPLAAMFAGLFLIVIVLLVAPLAAYLPNAAMAGILFLVAWGLIDFHEIGHVLKTSRRETGIMGVTFFGALFLELEFAIFAGVLLSLVLYLDAGIQAADHFACARSALAGPQIQHRSRAAQLPAAAYPACRWLTVFRFHQPRSGGFRGPRRATSRAEAPGHRRRRYQLRRYHRRCHPGQGSPQTQGARRQPLSHEGQEGPVGVAGELRLPGCHRAEQRLPVQDSRHHRYFPEAGQDRMPTL